MTSEATWDEAHRPPMTQRTHPIGRHRNVSWVKGQMMRSSACTEPKKEALSGVRVHAGTAYVDMEVDRQPPADSPPGDYKITIVKETVKKSFEKWKNGNFFISLLYLRMTKRFWLQYCLRLCQTCKHGLWPMPGRTQLPTSRYLLSALKWPSWPPLIIILFLCGPLGLRQGGAIDCT